MKMSRWFLGITLVLMPVALFWASQRAASARPVKLGAPWNYPLIYFSSDSRYLVACQNESSNSGYLIFDVASRELVDRYKVDYLGVPPLFSPDGKRTAIVSAFEARPDPHPSRFLFAFPQFSVRDVGATKTQTVTDESRMAENEGDNTPDQSAVWNANGELVVVGTRQVRRFDAATGRLLSRATFRALPQLKKNQKYYIESGEHSAELALDGKSFVHWQAPATFVLRDSRFAREMRRIRLPHSESETPTFGISARGNVVWVVQSGTTFYDAKTGRALWNWKGLDSSYGVGATDFRLSADEKMVVACNGDHCTARALKNGAQLWKVRHPNSSIFALSPDGKTFAERRYDGQIMLWPMPQ